MFTINSTLGAILAASWVNSLLYMFEVCQVVHYFSKYPKDKSVLKSAVIAALIFDTACTFAVYSTVYLYLITNYGSLPMKKLWPIPIITITSGISGAIVESFLIFRLWNLSKQFFVTGVVSLGMILALGGALAGGIRSILHPSLLEPDKGEIISSEISLGLATATDVVVTAALLWKLAKVKSSFECTQGIIRRISIQAFQTGAVSSFVTAMILILHFTKDGLHVGNAIGFVVGRVYTITMLYNLNSRPRDGTLLHYAGEQGETVSLTTVHVHRTAVVHIDEMPDRVSILGESQQDETKTLQSFDVKEDEDKSRPAEKTFHEPRCL